MFAHEDDGDSRGETSERGGSFHRRRGKLLMGCCGGYMMPYSRVGESGLENQSIVS